MLKNHNFDLDNDPDGADMEPLLNKLTQLEGTLNRLATSNHADQLERDLSSLRSLAMDNQRDQKAALDSTEERIAALLRAQNRGSIFLNVLGFVGALLVLLLAALGV